MGLLAEQTITFPQGYVRFQLASTLTVGRDNGGETVDSVRYVINPISDRGAATDLIGQTAANSAYYGELSKGDDITRYAGKFYDEAGDIIKEKLIWRIDFLAIGNTEVFNIADIEDNLGNTLTSGGATYAKALRCMQTVKWPLLSAKESINLTLSNN